MYHQSSRVLIHNINKAHNPMNQIEEKRQHQRITLDALLNLHRMEDQDHSYADQMKDYSTGGLSMITREKLVMDQFIYLELIGDSQISIPDNKKNYAGKVKWVSEVSDFSDETGPQDSGPFYKYGVAFT